MSGVFLTDAEFDALVSAVALLDAERDNDRERGDAAAIREMAALSRAWRKVQLARQEHRL